ncbi:MAG: chromosome segregation SMC family protein, partial [Nitratireductor sp.]
MRFVKLRVLGFKSFVEPTEFLIEDGLTGVVGPNGCGKSNLVEALRWVMGENSYKNMRASGMDDVIFSGSGNRPARNTAEVTLFLDNSDRTAPAAFNDADELQVSRRIERESGSVYRINGKEVRAKDVQLLFADASTGARSPSMVGQGRIGELISAKPQARRALLEEAAGISGLHSRRHEAELRLRAAEQNLERLEDVVAQMESQLESLKRQARQANRYRALSAEIRQTEALLFHLRWAGAKEAEAEAQSVLSQATALAGEKAEAQANAAKEQAITASRLPQLRDNEAKAAAALQHLVITRNQIDEEAARLTARRNELQSRQDQLDSDIAREERMVSENGSALERLAAEEKELVAAGIDFSANAKRVNDRLEELSARLAESETRFAELTATHASENARKGQFERTRREATERGARLDDQLARIDAELKDVLGKIAALDDSAGKRERVELLENRAADAEKDALSAEQAAEKARAGEQASRAPLAEAQAELNRIETEALTLNRILNQGGQDLFPSVVERIKVEPGFETALGAALGEDLDISTDVSAPVRWSMVEGSGGDPALPAGVKPLSSVVKAPAELSRRLAQIGVVERARGTELQKMLQVGQRLVSLEGDLWRWDGYLAGAEAPTAAAQRLSQKNRLAELDAEAVEATRKLRSVEADCEEARKATIGAVESERAARDAWRSAQKQLADAREELAAAERAVNQYSSRKATLEDARNRVAADRQDNNAVLAEAEAAIAAMPDISDLANGLDQQRAIVATQRSEVAQARAESESLSREAQARERRLASIAGEMKSWRERAENAGKQIATLKERRDACASELAAIADAPDEIATRRRELARKIDEAEALRKSAADRLAAAELELANADKQARLTLDQLAETREARARAEERLNASRERRAEVEARIREELDCHPADVLKMAELEAGAKLPEAANVERNLERLKSERERLGAVNLRADTEQTEITERRDALIAERDDLVEAIRRLRQGIQSLNKEGRERLLEAFEVVNAQFQRLFTHLFGGGTAELQLVESDDPLEAGLEILARPPGKRPQTMTLLSGGEQALTAMALIFAVFLTNPAPICVLDEVDAPLDDHNVERYCNLMDEMGNTTNTRFVIITHNPITMARMNRLFGVTMAERGVSQLVSVDLQTAAQLAEAV